MPVWTCFWTTSLTALGQAILEVIGSGVSGKHGLAQIVGAGQNAGMGNDDAVCAALHGCCYSSLASRFSLAAGFLRRGAGRIRRIRPAYCLSSRPVSRVLCPGRGRGGGHLSRPGVAVGLVRPTRGLAGRPESLYLVLLQMGFARPACHHAAGALLPHHFTLTRPKAGGMFLLHFPSGRPPWALPSIFARWSSDFPLRQGEATTRPAGRTQYIGGISATVTPDTQ